MRDLMLRAPGSRFAIHAAVAVAVWAALTWLNGSVEPQISYYLALAAMYATAMFGMTILVGLSGQVSLGNGALMAVGGYVFALTSMHWTTVPLIGVPWNAVWSMVFAGLGGVVAGVLIGALGARLRGPYLAGLTLGIAVGVPTIVNRFPALLGGEEGLKLIVPYPEGGYPEEVDEVAEAAPVDDAFLDEFLVEPEATDVPADVATDVPADSGDLLTPEEAVSGVAEGDLLTPEEAVSGVAEGDLLTPEEAVSGVAEGDLLTPEEAVSGVATEAPMDAASDPTMLPEVPVEGVEAVAQTAVGTDFVLQQWQASVAIAVACVVGFLAVNLVSGRQGRVWQAVRDDPVAAAVVGIAPAGAKVSAFVVSSLFAALAGAVLAQILTFVGAGAFGLGLSLSLLVGVVLGGRMSLAGAAIGAVLLVWLPELVNNLSADRGWPDQVTNNAPNLLYGLLVVAVVLIAPGGLMGAVGAGWSRLRHRKSA
jgi:ABC-type branched-subunit amino acid transport system permease subunit